MSRRVRRLLLLAVLIVVIGGVVLVVTGRGPLQDDRDAVDDAWIPLRAPLDERYVALAGVDEQLRAAGGADRDVATDLTAELNEWQQVSDQPDDDAAAEDEVQIANTLEGLSALVIANVNASERLRSSAPLTESLATFSATVPDAALVNAYNDAVRTYVDTRGSLLKKPAAALFGYDDQPSLTLAT
jgi:hypothetical protein